MRTFASFALLALAGLTAAQAPSDAAVKLVGEQFKGALITPAVITQFDPKGIVNLEFTGVGKVTNGQALTPAQTATKPAISFAAPAAAYANIDSPLNKTTTTYTFMVIDGDYPGANDPRGLSTHWISNGWGHGGVKDGVLTFTQPQIQPIIDYAGPGPDAGSGAHRYIFLIFPEPTGYKAPAVPAPGGSVFRINYNDYTNGLGSPVGGVYFVVEVGTATVVASPTSAVTAPAATGTQAGSTPGAATGTGTRPATTTGAGAATTSSSSSASKFSSQLTGASIAGAAVFVAAAFFA